MIGCHCLVPPWGRTWLGRAVRFSGSAFAAVWDAVRCSGSADIVIGASGIVALAVAPKPVSNGTAAPTAGINEARKAASIIATANRSTADDAALARA